MTSNSGDYAYVSNSASGPSYLNAYELSTGVPLLISGFPTNLNFVPLSMVVNPSNTYLFVASAATSLIGPSIYSYSISSTGSLQITNGGAPQITLSLSTGVTAMAISPDGQWLFALDPLSGSLREYTINSGGTLMQNIAPLLTTPSFPSVSGTSVAVAPSGQYVAVALGLAGDVLFPFTTSTGALGSGDTLPTGSPTVSHSAVTMDSNNNLFIAETSGIVEYALSVANNLVVVTPVGSVLTTSPPGAIVLNSADTFVFGGNTIAGTISAAAVPLTTSSTVVSGSPFAASPLLGQLGRDNTGKYLLSVGTDATNGLRMFSIGATGALTNTGNAGLGTSQTGTPLIALTH